MADTTARAAPINALLRIPIDQVVPGPNARGDLGDITGLALSIKTLGMKQPLLVTDTGDTFQVIDGHRRLAAAHQLGHKHVDAIVRMNPGEQLLQLQLGMNAQSQRFNPIAEARALHKLMFEQKLTREQIAAAVGKSPNWVRDRIGLLQLGDDEQERVAAGTLPVNEATIRLRSRAAGDGKASPHLVTTRHTARAPQRHCATCQCGGT